MQCSEQRRSTPVQFDYDRGFLRSQWCPDMGGSVRRRVGLVVGPTSVNVPLHSQEAIGSVTRSSVHVLHRLHRAVINIVEKLETIVHAT